MVIGISVHYNGVRDRIVEALSPSFMEIPTQVKVSNILYTLCTMKRFTPMCPSFTIS